jgi:non-heme chloroperoxidase
VLGHRALAVVVFLAVVVSAAHARTDPSPHSASFVGVEQGVVLEVLDWGGQGPPLILLTGLGETAHVFDDFAVHLTDRFHVLGVTRRGAGASSRPEDGYDTATLAHDLGTVLRHLGITPAILVGHSAAGAEMTAFAVSSPDRVQGLVYLDAAYDLTIQPKTPMIQPVPTPEERLSMAGMKKFLKRTVGVDFPDGEWQAIAEFNPDGSFRRTRNITNEVSEKMFAGFDHPAFAQVRAPVLAIYAKVEAASIFPDEANFNAADKRQADAYASELAGRAEAAMAALRAAKPDAHIVVLAPANHAVFLSNEADVLRVIREFLAAVLP